MKKPGVNKQTCSSLILADGQLQRPFPPVLSEFLEKVIHLHFTLVFDLSVFPLSPRSSQVQNTHASQEIVSGRLYPNCGLNTIYQWFTADHSYFRDAWLVTGLSAFLARKYLGIASADFFRKNCLFMNYVGFSYLEGTLCVLATLSFSFH